MEDIDILKRLVRECFYIDYDGKVNWKYNECFSMDASKPELAKLIKPFITDNWKKIKEQYIS